MTPPAVPARADSLRHAQGDVLCPLLKDSPVGTEYRVRESESEIRFSPCGEIERKSMKYTNASWRKQTVPFEYVRGRSGEETQSGGLLFLRNSFPSAFAAAARCKGVMCDARPNTAASTAASQVKLASPGITGRQANGRVRARRMK